MHYGCTSPLGYLGIAANHCMSEPQFISLEDLYTTWYPSHVWITSKCVCTLAPLAQPPYLPHRANCIKTRSDEP